MLVLPLFMYGSAIAGELPAGLSWGDSVGPAAAVLEKRCRLTHPIEVDPPSFPLAEHEECHYLCEDLQSERNRVSQAVFVFADDKLVMIEARGGAIAAFARPSADSDSYMHYEIHKEGEVWVDTEADAVWFLNDAARHPNLFTFSNPFLSGQSDELPQYVKSAAIPPILDFDVSLEHANSRFISSCPLLYSEDSRVWLPNKPSKQVQVNCFGYEYGGFPRKFEAIYGDGRLEMVWILTGKGEEVRLRQALIAAFGPAEHINDQWEIFARFRVALRKDKPEILLLSEEMVSHYQAELLGEPE